MSKKIKVNNEGLETTPSSSKEELENIIARYKVQNPVKYEMKKEALEKRLASL